MTELKDPKSAWFKKSATLIDKTTRKEFGLAQEEIIKGIEDGKLNYHVNTVLIWTNK